MNGKELIEKVELNIKKGYLLNGVNVMGCSESMYDPEYLIYKAFKDSKKLSKLKKMSDSNLDDLLIVAKYATEVFY